MNTDTGEFRPISSDNPVKPDEMVISDEDRKRLEQFPPEQRADELRRINMERLRALEAHHGPEEAERQKATYPDPEDSHYAEKVAIAYKAMTDALLAPPPKTLEQKDLELKQAADKAKRRKRAKAAKKSKQKNR